MAQPFKLHRLFFLVTRPSPTISFFKKFFHPSLIKRRKVQLQKVSSPLRRQGRFQSRQNFSFVVNCCAHAPEFSDSDFESPEQFIDKIGGWKRSRRAEVRKPLDPSGIIYSLLTRDYSLPLRPSLTLRLFREIMNLDLEPPNGI